MNLSVTHRLLFPGNLQCLRRSFHTTTTSYGKKWKLKKVKETIVDPSRLKIDEPVSGSKIFPEDMAEINSRKFELDVAGLNKRGFLRFQKGYEAPPNSIERLLSVARSMNPKLQAATENDLIDFELSDPSFKYDFLSRAGKEFQHWVPNSLLYHIITIRDAAKFYNTSVKTSTPYDDLQKMEDLPANIHIQPHAVRFDPATDTFFGGVSAFPQSSTLVTGLRAKMKYKTVHQPHLLDYVKK